MIGGSWSKGKFRHGGRRGNLERLMREPREGVENWEQTLSHRIDLESLRGNPYHHQRTEVKEAEVVRMEQEARKRAPAPEDRRWSHNRGQNQTRHSGRQVLIQVSEYSEKLQCRLLDLR